MIQLSDIEFSRSGLRRIIALSRLMYLKNPLIQPGVNVKGYYVWAKASRSPARDETSTSIIQPWIDDPTPAKRTVRRRGPPAQRADARRPTGNLFFILFPNTSTGNV